MPEEQTPQIQWITLPRLAELTGLTKEAIRAMIKKGKLEIDYHWRKKGGRIYLNARRFDEWVEGKVPRNIPV